MSSICPRTLTSPEHQTSPLGLTLYYGSSWAETGHRLAPTTPSPTSDPFRTDRTNMQPLTLSSFQIDCKHPCS